MCLIKMSQKVFGDFCAKIWINYKYAMYLFPVLLLMLTLNYVDVIEQVLNIV